MFTFFFSFSLSFSSICCSTRTLSSLCVCVCLNVCWSDRCVRNTQHMYIALSSHTFTLMYTKHITWFACVWVGVGETAARRGARQGETLPRFDPPPTTDTQLQPHKHSQHTDTHSFAGTCANHLSIAYQTWRAQKQCGMWSAVRHFLFNLTSNTTQPTKNT